MSSTNDSFPAGGPAPKPSSTIQDDASTTRSEPGSPTAATTLPQEPEVPLKPPYSIYTQRQKYFITALVSSTALLSPLTANIVIPILPSIANAFKVSTQEVNLTVTVYLIMQGCAPTFWGSLADVIGRRPVFLGTLSIYIAACIGLACVPTSAYGGLLALRLLQAFGVASTVAISAGCISDIADTHERGTFLGLNSMGQMVGPALGPIIGGALADGLGWRSIFWALVIITGCCLVPLSLFLPETTRSIVGDGSIPPPTLNTRLIDLFNARKRRRSLGPDDDAEAHVDEKDVQPVKSFQDRWATFNPLASLLLLRQPEIALSLLYGSLSYTEFYMVLTSMSTSFKAVYGLSETIIGICYLANGFGSLLSPIITGRLLDRRYKSMRAALPSDTPARGIPLEHTRIMPFWPLYTVIFHIACIGYGWVIETRTNIAAALVCQFFIGFCASGMMLITQTLVVDFAPGRGGSVVASFNFCRCLMGAGGTAIIDVLITRLNAGWAFVLASGIALSFSWMPYLVLRRGPAWREKRLLEREAARVKEEEKFQRRVRARSEKADRKAEKAAGSGASTPRRGKKNFGDGIGRLEGSE